MFFQFNCKNRRRCSRERAPTCLPYDYAGYSGELSSERDAREKRKNERKRERKRERAAKSIENLMATRSNVLKASPKVTRVHENPQSSNNPEPCHDLRAKLGAHTLGWWRNCARRTAEGMWKVSASDHICARSTQSFARWDHTLGIMFGSLKPSAIQVHQWNTRTCRP